MVEIANKSAKQTREEQRLRALKEFDILDTLPEKAFDDLTALASYICNTPIALISLIDEDRQWFKSNVGLGVPETSRNIAFCAHAIEQPDCFIVPDASIDDRFSANPLVTGSPFVRFYAGSPLVTSEGHALGTLCVIDREPRQMSPEQIMALNALSRQVMTQLEVRNIARRLVQARNDVIYLQEEIASDHNFGEIIGRSEALSEVMRKTRQVAATDTTVLIMGETGTGKELVARAIHGGSPRRSRPMVKVNCAALPANLIESELFGHEKGSFTGAQAARIGRFEMANGGTIFLDEIGELPLDLQSKLLRVLQEGEFERLGSSRTIKVDVRVIAATNRDLEQASREGTFRSDLYYRLHVFPLIVPPLRERTGDIPMLVQSFIDKENARLGKNIDTISRQTMEALQNYPWYGNIRELQAVIERAAILTEGNELVISDDLSPKKNGLSAPPEVSEQVKSLEVDDDELIPLQDMERRYILKALARTKWRIHGKDGAADILGMNPNTLRSRMQKLGIERPIA
jgi:formate hydrogenlyase transcriptional activator